MLSSNNDIEKNLKDKQFLYKHYHDLQNYAKLHLFKGEVVHVKDKGYNVSEAKILRSGQSHK